MTALKEYFEVFAVSNKPLKQLGDILDNSGFEIDEAIQEGTLMQIWMKNDDTGDKVLINCPDIHTNGSGTVRKYQQSTDEFSDPVPLTDFIKLQMN